MAFGQGSVKKGDPCSVEGSCQLAQCVWADAKLPTLPLSLLPRHLCLSFFAQRSLFSSWDLMIVKRLTQRRSKDVSLC